MKNKILFVGLVIISTLTVFGQSKKAFINAADAAMAEQNYHGALVYYNEVLSFDKTDADIVYKTAEAARMYNAYAYATTKYHYLLDTLKNDQYTDVSFRLGEMYQKLGYYDKAIKYFNLYLSEYSNTDQSLTAKARIGISSCQKAKELIKNIDTDVIITRLGDDVNSADADFGATEVNGKMYFSSNRYESNAKALRYKQIAKTLVKSTSDATADVVSGYVNDRNLSVANFAANMTGSKVYYSLCEYINGFQQRCDVYSSDVDKDGNLSNETKLPLLINDPNSTNTQPNIGFNKATGKEVLYFVSDRVGGLGGFDIWSSTIDGANFSRPENLKTINTIENDITPFYHNATQTLYFSTDGREGFGGYDVFGSFNSSSAPELLPAPYNTSMNDMYYYLNQAGTKGYITSNRAGSNYQFDSYEACCMDIYGVDVEDEILLEALTFFTADGTALDLTTVCLLDGDTGEEIECVTSKLGDNNHTFKLKSNRNYKLVATRNGYTVDTQTFRTDGVDKSLSKKLYLTKDKIKLDVFTFDAKTKESLIGTTVTLINLTDRTSKQVVITNANANDFSFDVDPDKEYQLIATKDGYNIAKENVSTKGAKGNIKKDMFLQKTLLQDLLPISLYFDNDYPNPRSNSPQTTTQYVALANDYLKRKDEYIKNYAAPLTGDVKTKAIEEIEYFFTEDVKIGKEKFERFLVQLQQRLDMGEKIELEVRGFASPRAKSTYNKILSERRINCIKNEMRIYGGGGISKYLAKGSLKLKDVSFGNETAPSNVIGDLNDERNSIYNLNAARERRVEILKVNYN